MPSLKRARRKATGGEDIAAGCTQMFRRHRSRPIQARIKLSCYTLPPVEAIFKGITSAATSLDAMAGPRRPHPWS